MTDIDAIRRKHEMSDLEKLLLDQAVEIADAGHAGWGNTMTTAASAIAALTRTLREASDGHKLLKEENERLTKYTQEMVRIQAENRLDGYRELGVRAANAENERDTIKQSLAAAELREKVVRFIYLADHFAFQTEPPDPHAEGEGCRDCDYRREIEDAAKQYNVAEYAEQLLGGEK